MYSFRSGGKKKRAPGYKIFSYRRKKKSKIAGEEKNKKRVKKGGLKVYIHSELVKIRNET